MGSEVADGTKIKIGRQCRTYFPNALGVAAATVPPVDLRLDQWRRLVFGDAGVDAPTQFAVSNTIEKINQQTNSEPDKETNPGEHRQAEHEHETQEHADDRK